MERSSASVGSGIFRCRFRLSPVAGVAQSLNGFPCRGGRDEARISGLCPSKAENPSLFVQPMILPENIASQATPHGVPGACEPVSDAKPSRSRQDALSPGLRTPVGGHLTGHRASAPAQAAKRGRLAPPLDRNGRRPGRPGLTARLARLRPWN
jgi:hypothetical protein